MPDNHLRIILIYTAVAVFFCAGAVERIAAQDVPAAARRLAATAQLAAGGDRLGVGGGGGRARPRVGEYRLGGSGGRVIAVPEVEEARLFLAEARRNAARIPEPEAARALRALDGLDSLVARTADPDSVARRVAPGRR